MLPQIVSRASRASGIGRFKVSRPLSVWSKLRDALSDGPSTSYSDPTESEAPGCASGAAAPTGPTPLGALGGVACAPLR